MRRYNKRANTPEASKWTVEWLWMSAWSAKNIRNTRKEFTQRRGGHARIHAHGVDAGVTPTQQHYIPRSTCTTHINHAH